MIIKIKDLAGLGTALMMKGYTQAQMQEAQDAIRKQFRETAELVLSTLLGAPLPETIVVRMELNDWEESDHTKDCSLACLNLSLSKNHTLVFSVYENTVKNILRHADDGRYVRTVVHEMMHAADMPLLKKNVALLIALSKEANSSLYDQFAGCSTSRALLGILSMLHHYRAEGIAILGGHLLTQSQFRNDNQSMEMFQSIFEQNILMNKLLVTRNVDAGLEPISYATQHMAYQVAPFILLRVLRVLNIMDQDTCTKVLTGLETGQYDLTMENSMMIIRASLSLSLSQYIQGLISLGDEITSVQPFLEFCSTLQKDSIEENVEVFAQLVSQPTTTQAFEKAMEDIMRSLILETDIDAFYYVFCQAPPDAAEYPGLKEKIDMLYSILKNEKDVAKKRIAHWALTYYFDEMDAIHDEVRGVGFVDDLIVIDYAFNVLQLQKD